MTALAVTEEEAKRLLQAASDNKIVLRLLGGVAVALRCPSASRDGLRRTYVDIDFASHEKQSKAITDFFIEMGYKPRVRFNAMMGRKRLIFNDIVNQRRVDLFLDVFEMSHRLNFAERLDLEPFTLPLADLLATKLQIVQTDEKDFKDMAALFLDHDVGTSDGETINGRYLARLCSNDWGLHKTFTTNLSRLGTAIDGFDLAQSEVATARVRIGRLLEMIEAEPKSLAWRLRATIGERIRWYELPEADKSAIVESLSQPEVRR